MRPRIISPSVPLALALVLVLAGCSSAIELPPGSGSALCADLDRTFSLSPMDSIDALQLQILQSGDDYLMGRATPDGFEITHLVADLSPVAANAFSGANRRWLLRAHPGGFVLVSGPLALGAPGEAIRVETLGPTGQAVAAPTAFVPDQPARLLSADVVPGQLFIGYASGDENAGRAEAAVTVAPHGMLRVSAIAPRFVTPCPGCAEISMGPSDTWLRGEVEGARSLHHRAGDGRDRAWPLGWETVDTFHRDARDGAVWGLSAWFGHGRHQTAHRLDATSPDGLGPAVGDEFDAFAPFFIDTPSGPMILLGGRPLNGWLVADTARPASLFHCEECDFSAFERRLTTARFSERLDGYLLGIASVDEVRIVCAPSSDVVPVETYWSERM